MLVKIWYGFSKRKNSTKQPADSDAYEITCRLKDNTNYQNLELFLTSSHAPTFNYLQCFSRYYFVDNFEYVTNNTYIVHCSVDVLATYKSAVGGSSFYVERAQSSYDQYISDGVLSSRNFYVNSSQSQSDSISDFSGVGTYLITVTGGNQESSDFGVTTYACSQSEIISVLDFMFDDGNFTDVFTDGAVKTFFNPFQYILSLKWFPFNTSTATFGTTFSTVKFGWWDTGVNARVVRTKGKQFTLTCAIPSHTYTDFRRYSSYWSHYRAYIPTVGVIDIAPQDLVSSSISVDFVIDWITAQSYVRVYSDTDTLTCELTGCAGADVQISQNTANIIQGVSNIAGGVLGSIFSPSSMVSGISSAIQGVQDIMSPTPSSNGVGGNKSILTFYPKIEMWCEELASTDYQTSQVGRPLCQTVQINSLSGYVQCAGASIQNAAYGIEKDMINSYLNGGFWYE